MVGWSRGEGPRQASENRLRVLGEARRAAGKLQGFRYSPLPHPMNPWGKKKEKPLVACFRRLPCVAEGTGEPSREG